MKKISTLFCIVLAGVFSALLSACNSKAYNVSENPQLFTGKVEYTAKGIMPTLTSSKYKYSFYDSKGKFVAEIDFSKAMISNIENYLDRAVIMRGVLKDTKEDGRVIEADHIRFNK